MATSRAPVRRALPRPDLADILGVDTEEQRELCEPLVEQRLPVHEDERGSLELGEHPLAARLAGLLEDPTPFCEECMTAGEQQFGELVVHAPSRRRSA